MGTLTALMHVVTGALASDETALAATASNISNQNTAGYTRRNVTWTEGDVVTVGAGTSPGVRASVAAQRDKVLQRSVQNATEAASGSSTRLSALNQLQDLFKIDASGDDAAGIGAALSGIFNAASSLASSPGDTSLQNSLYTAAETFASTFNRAAARISSQQDSLNQQVTSSVTQVNTLAAQVAVLNQQISQAPDDSARDTLLDQRDTAVTQLSTLIDVNTVQTEAQGLNLTLSDGTPLVIGAKQMPLSTGYVSGTARIYAASAGGGEVTSAVRGGSIAGSLQARDIDIPAVRSQLDLIATAVADRVNQQNAFGTLPSGVQGGAIFSGNSAATLAVIASTGADFATEGADGVDGSNAQAIGNLQSSAIVDGKSPSASFSNLLTKLGGSVSGVDIQSTADSAILAQTTNLLAATSGVSLDQEAANLTQYQRSYEAAAKVLSIVDELLAQAINLGQVTTVS